MLISVEHVGCQRPSNIFDLLFLGTFLRTLAFANGTPSGAQLIVLPRMGATPECEGAKAGPNPGFYHEMT